MKKGSQRGPKIPSKSHQILSRKHPQKTYKKVTKRTGSRGPLPAPRATPWLLLIAGGVPFSRIQGQVFETVEYNQSKKAEA